MPATAYRFGPFELRAGEHILTSNGTRVPLSPKAFDLLHLLVRHNGSLLEKRELLATLWPRTFVEEANLSVQVAAIRKALHPQLADAIETVPKRGYRFVAAVERDTTAGPVDTPASAVRLLVLPLRVLAPDLEAEFLSRSLPDAIAAALVDIPWLSVRAPLDAHAPADAGAHGADGADAILEGALGALAGQSSLQLRLLHSPTGAVLYAEQTIVSLDHLHDLQARVARQLRARLAAHFRRPEPRPHDPCTTVPPGAYVLYLRANQLAYETSQWETARDLYEAVTRDAPDFAPAWARLGRCHRVIAKFAADDAASAESFVRAEAALSRALALDPDLSLAHNLYAQLDVDMGRPEPAMQRLVSRIAATPHSPDLFAGLVHVLRFCGLLDLSLAAHRRARQLDPTMPTSVHHTWWMKGEYERALDETFGDIGYLPGLALASLGRHDDAVAALRWRERGLPDGRARDYLVSLRACLEGRHDESREALAGLRRAIDAEARYYVARTYVPLGERDLALHDLEAAVEGGFLCHETFTRDPWLRDLHGDPRFERLVARARKRSARAAALFAEAGGHRLLGA